MYNFFGTSQQGSQHQAQHTNQQPTNSGQNQTQYTQSFYPQGQTQQGPYGYQTQYNPYGTNMNNPYQGHYQHQQQQYPQYQQQTYQQPQYQSNYPPNYQQQQQHIPPMGAILDGIFGNPLRSHFETHQQQHERAQQYPHHHHQQQQQHRQQQRQQQQQHRQRQQQHMRDHQQQHAQSMSSQQGIFGGFPNMTGLFSQLFGDVQSLFQPQQQHHHYHQHHPHHHYHHHHPHHQHHHHHPHQHQHQHPHQRQQQQQQEEPEPGTMPTAQKTLASLPRYKFTRHRARYVKEFNLEHTCSVCLDEFQLNDLVLRLPCQHEYHTGCIEPWLQGKNTCPMCRFELPVDHPRAEQTRLKRMIERYTKEGLTIFMCAAQIENICSDYFDFEKTWEDNLKLTSKQLKDKLTKMESDLMGILTKLDGIESESQADERREQIHRIHCLFKRIAETKDKIV